MKTLLVLILILSTLAANGSGYGEWLEYYYLDEKGKLNGEELCMTKREKYDCKGLTVSQGKCMTDDANKTRAEYKNK